MDVKTTLTVHWLSFFIHCLVLVLSTVSFSLPYWYVNDKSVDGREIAGLWVRCREGGSCRSVIGSTYPLEVDIVAVQTLATISLALSAVTSVVYTLWLWKGEVCATPWSKRCLCFEEAHLRSSKPAEVIKYARLKWLAFSLATVSGVLLLAASVYFMMSLMSNDGLTAANIGWSAWLALTAAVILLAQHLFLSLPFYVLSGSDPARTVDDRDDTGEEYDHGELERIQKWIMEQRQGMENPSFENGQESGTRAALPIRTKRARSRSSASSIFYSGQSLSSSSVSSIYGPAGVVSHQAGRKTRFLPIYSVIFKDKIPMIPRDDLSPRSRYVYDVIYRGDKVAEGRRKRATQMDASFRSNPGYHERQKGGVYKSDSDTAVGQISWNPGADRSSPSVSSYDTDPECLQPGIIPEAYRKRKRKHRRHSLSSPPLSRSEQEIQNFGLDETQPKNEFQLENIWVAEGREAVKEAVGKRHVHFNPEQSLNDSIEHSEI